MHRLLLLGTLCALPLLARAQAPSPHPADVLAARLGPTIDPDEQAHFGLFPRIARTAFVSAQYAPAGDGLRLRVEARGGRDTTWMLTAEQGAALALYVDEYEALFTDAPPPALDRAAAVLAAAGVSRRSLVAADRRVAVALRDGTRRDGALLYAGPEGVALFTPGTPYRWERTDDLVWIPAGAIVQVRQTGPRQRVLYGAQLATAAGLFAAQIATAEDDGERYRPTGVGVGAVVGGASLVLLSAVTNNGPGRAWLPASVQRVALFARSAPPEFNRWLAQQERTASPPPYAVPAYQPRLRLTVLDAWSPPGSASYTQVATFDRPFRPTQTETFTEEAYVPSRQQALTIDAEVRVWRAVHVGAAQTWARDAAADLPETRERFDDRGMTLGFVSVALGDVLRLPRWSALSVGVGAARTSGRLSGVLYGTRAFQDGPPDEANLERYSFTVEQWHPAARVVVDLYGTRALSLVGRVTYVPGQRVEVPGIESEGGLSGNRWSNTQAAHTLTLSPLSVGVGLRAHL